MKQFQKNKIYVVKSYSINNNWKVRFKITELERNKVLFGSIIRDEVKVELISIETNYVGNMPILLFNFLKSWFDYGYCNHYQIRDNGEFEFICLMDPNQRFADNLCLLAREDLEEEAK